MCRGGKISLLHRSTLSYDPDKPFVCECKISQQLKKEDTYMNMWHIWINNPDQHYFPARWTRLMIKTTHLVIACALYDFHRIVAVGCGTRGGGSCLIMRESLTQLSFINTVRTGVLFLWCLKDLWQYPKAKASTAQRTPKCVGVNWMTQSISIKDFKALVPLCVWQKIEIGYRWLLLWACSK